MTSLQSSQNFVRALKATSDPPALDGPFKIQLARQAWDDASFYVPSKAEVVVDWILTKFSKEKAKEPSTNPLADLRYWALLSDVISSRDPSVTVVTSRPLKTWLTSLLNRIHIGPVIIAFLNIFDQLERGVKAQLSAVVSSCLDVIWPLGAQKTSTELLLECWGAFLLALTKNETGPGICKIGVLITASYRRSLSNSSNKKKLYSTFIQTSLERWLECIAVDPPSSYKTLLENIFNAGTETIFSLDNLRQSQDANSDAFLFDPLQKLPKSSKTLALTILPRLFIAYIQAIKRYRGTLFSQGSNQLPGAATDELRAAGMRFFASCQPLLEESNVQAWTTRASLLTILDQENLFRRQQLDAGIVLNQNIDLALTILSTGWEVDQSDVTALCVQCLTTIAQIDYDLILPAIPRILPRLLLIPNPKQEHFVFLDLLLNYYTKTRTMGTYITNLLSALSPKHLMMIPGGARETYRISLSAPLLHAIHLERISKAISKFLTPGQCLSTVDSILGSLDTAWEQQHSADKQREAASGEGSRKKRKTDTSSTEMVQDPEILAVTFSLSARLAHIVLSSLPTQSLPATMRTEVHGRLSSFRDNLLRDILKKSLKTIHKQGKNDGWSTQVVAAATLRLQYALSVSKSISLTSIDDIKITGKLSDTLDDDALLPELSLEIFRVLLHRTSPDNISESQGNIDRVLAYLEASFKPTDVSWSGQEFRLTFGEHGKAESALALLHMVLERWLPVIELVAMQAQLERLIRIIMSIRTTPSAADSSALAHELRPHDLLMRTLRCAQFWELQNIRNVFLPHLTQTTASLEKLGSSKAKPSKLTETISAYRLLLLFPIEYFSRGSRVEFVKRALQADMYVSRLSIGEHYTADFLCEALTVLRVFLKRVFSHAGAVEQQSNQELAEFLEHLMVQDKSTLLNAGEFSVATLDLVELYFSELLKTAQKGTPEGLLKALSLFSQYALFDGLESLPSQAFARMIELLTTSFSTTNFSEEVQTSMRDLHKHLVSAVLPRISAASTSGDKLLDGNELLSGWCYLLAFGKWLGYNDGDIQFFGQHLASRIVSAPAPNSASLDKIRVTTFAILLQELHYRTDIQRAPHLDLVVAAYISFSQIVQQDQREQMDDHFSKTCRSLSPSHYAHILDLAAESLSSDQNTQDTLVRLVHLSALLLREHPQNTLKPMQTFATKCIVAFSGRDVFTVGPVSLRLQVLELVSQHCAERPAALRVVDIGNIWALLSQFLAPSHEHDDATTPEIYQKIIAIISALIRLRRDLITPTLPQLGMILRQLLLYTRSCRPHLGTKQSTLVTDTLPQWINSAHPIGAEEVKVLSRLLETLDIKTIVRTHASGNEAQTAESLAKPFSKHAAYVVKAYIEAMNDPLCILSLELRKELKPGLFALCNIMNEHGRDAMMVSALDAGEKTTMKSLWSEYEKQRYVGKG